LLAVKTDFVITPLPFSPTDNCKLSTVYFPFSPPCGILKPMNVGVAKVSLRIPENMDLKGKRMVLKSIIGRVKSRFDVALAEVDDNDSWQSAVIGICCISNDKRHTNEVLSKVVRFIETGRFDVEFLDYSIEIIDI
jgi:uncharacterized protein YlxP (DUF503 family)